MSNHGYAEGETGSPRTVLKTAYKVGMISDEELWLNAIVSYNNVAHVDNKATALAIIDQTKSNNYDMHANLSQTKPVLYSII